MEEEVMATFYMRHALTKIISCCHIVERGKGKLVCCFAQWRTTSKESALCVCIYWKVWALSSQWNTQKQKCKGLEQFGRAFPKLGTCSTEPGCHLPNTSAAKHVDELLVLLSVRGISCGGRLYLICAMIAAPSCMFGLFFGVFFCEI